MNVQFANLSDVCAINPTTPKGIPDDTCVSFLSMSSVSEQGVIEQEETRRFADVKKGYTYFERGDVLLAKITPCFENGKAALTNKLSRQIGFGSTEFHVIRPSPEVDARYVFYLLWNDHFRKAASGGMTGSAGQKRVPADLLKSLPIPLPPLDEQRRIAAILDKAHVLRQKRNRVVALLDSLTQSIFLEMFGDPDSNPKGWKSVSLSDLIEKSDRLNYGVVQPGDAVEDGVPLIRVSDLKSGRVKHDSLRTVAPAVSNKHSSSVLKGTEILVSCVGSIGEVALASEAEKGFNIARAVARIPLSPKYSRVFVSEFLRTEHVRRYFTKELRTVSQPTLNIKQIAETKIPLPDMDVIVEFETVYKKHSTLIGLARTQSAKIDMMFFSLQHRAFTGQL